MTRVLLTGGTGFVGVHVARAFMDAGCSVRVLARSPERARELDGLGVELAWGSLEQPEQLAAACRGVDVVVHMAALTHARTDAEYNRVNEAGTAALLDAALAADPAPVRFVYLSSLAAVGPSVDGRGVRAEDAPRPLTAYGRSKLAGERVCEAAASRIEMVIVRAPAVYGPRDTDLFHFFRLASLGVVPVPTGPERMLQMIHVEDLARGLVHAAVTPGAAGVYHVAEAQQYTWKEMGRLVGDAVGRRVRFVPLPATLLRGFAAVSEFGAGLAGRSSIFNRDKARELLAPGWLCETDAARAGLGYETVIPLSDGFRSTAAWYREQGWL